MDLCGGQNKSLKRDDMPNHPRVWVNGRSPATYFICGITNRLSHCQVCNSGWVGPCPKAKTQTKLSPGVNPRIRWRVYLKNLEPCGQNKLHYCQTSMTLFGIPLGKLFGDL